jgi:hypothetical protein
MKAALLALWALLKTPLVGLLQSKKVWTMALGVVTSQAAKHGFEVDPVTYWTIVGFFTALLAAQAVNDHGKGAAQVHADSMNAPSGSLPPTVTEEDLPAPSSQGGFASLRLLAAIVVLGTLAISACGASQREKTIHVTYATVVAADAAFVAWDAEHTKAIAHDPKYTTAEDAIAALQHYQAERTKVLDGFDVAYRLLAAAAIVEDNPKSLDSALKAWDELAAAIHTVTGGKL